MGFIFGQVSSPEYWRAVRVVLVNFLCVTPVFLVTIYPLTKWSNMSYGNNLPSLSVVVRDLITGTLLLEVTFYYSHR